MPIATLTIIAGTVLWAISVVGTPETVRNKELDKARISDLQRIYWAIGLFYEDKGELPSRLEELDLEKHFLQDPATGNAYGYVVLDSKKYQLSANFTYEGTDDRYSSREDEWSHPAGVHHFSFSPTENKIEVY